MRTYLMPVAVLGVLMVSMPVALAAVLHPEMKPASGTTQHPMGSLGEKPAAPWSATTIEAAPDHKALQGKVVTLTGEIIDVSCYLQVGKHGEKHRDCAQKCLRNGSPIGLLTSDGSVYLLIEEEHHPRRDGHTNFRASAIDHTAHVMSVTGTMTNVAGHKALYVHGYVVKAAAAPATP